MNNYTCVVKLKGDKNQLYSKHVFSYLNELLNQFKYVVLDYTSIIT